MASWTSRMADLGRRLLSRVRIRSVRWKELNELTYWWRRKKVEGVLANDHYRYFYTTHFGLPESYFDGKTLLDIGCGPRGSLEWASKAARRIGLDPLADEYLRLGADRHEMEYVAAPSEDIPLEDGTCDAVFAFNSLDHVEDVEQTLGEIKRVLRPGGIFLLLVEVNHPPTACEPHRLAPRQLVEALAPELVCERLEVYRPVVKGIYQSIREDEKIARPEDTEEIGYLSARFLRADATSPRGTPPRC